MANPEGLGTDDLTVVDHNPQMLFAEEDDVT
jgi:hypothetical protein